MGRAPRVHRAAEHEIAVGAIEVLRQQSQFKNSPTAPN